MATRRLRCCQDCLAGKHDIDTDNWRTDFLLLERRKCACATCDCTFLRALVREPRYDQRHHEPFTHRKRRCHPRHAA